MLLLILGLILFLGVHSTRLFAPEWRAKQIAAKGLMAWKGIYALASIVGLVLGVTGLDAPPGRAADHSCIYPAGRNLHPGHLHEGSGRSSDVTGGEILGVGPPASQWRAG